MPSLNFEKEEGEFRRFYDKNSQLLEDAKNSYIALITALVKSSESILVSKIEGRVKDRDECIKKFKRKYLIPLEQSGTPYSIEERITDLIGLRVVCLYEDQIDEVRSRLAEHFEVIDITDKISQIEKTEDSFGYKGLHLDLQLNEQRRRLTEYSSYGRFRFEVQIRTIIQDAWSVLDHKIKYKKSIPPSLKRRINTLAALFELADREFREIRDATQQEIEKAIDGYPQEANAAPGSGEQDIPEGRYVRLNAFSFLRIAQHFFPSDSFEPHKADGFTQEIVDCSPTISRGKFNDYMRENISDVKNFATNSGDEKISSEPFSPYTIIRHCLYLGDKSLFSSILSNDAKDRFEQWRARTSQHQDPADGANES
jgi:putative GTP pyrophosphokinase